MECGAIGGGLWEGKAGLTKGAGPRMGVAGESRRAWPAGNRRRGLLEEPGLGEGTQDPLPFLFSFCLPFLRPQ